VTLEFDFREPAGWTAVIAAFARRPIDDDTSVVLTGNCQRCSHFMDVHLPLAPAPGMLPGGAEAVQGAPPPAPPEGAKTFRKTARCNCLMDHEGRPAAQPGGCGAFGRVEVIVAGGKLFDVNPSDGLASLYEAEWDRRAEELELNALRNVRAAAEKWTAAIAAVLAIFSIVTLVKGPEDVQKVTGAFLLPLDVWVGLFIFLAVGAAIAATVLAALAAYGSVDVLVWVGDIVRARSRKAAAAASEDLWLAIWLSIAAVVLLMAATVVTWYATPDPPATPASASNIGYQRAGQ
jgi:hypothetical protein